MTSGRSSGMSASERGVGAHVVEGDPPALGTCPLYRRQQLCQPAGQRALRELDDAANAGSRRWQRGEAAGVGLGVDEERQRCTDGVGLRAGEGRLLARRVELREAVLAPRGREQLVGAFERRSLRPARERLEAEQRAGFKIHDGLQHRADVEPARRMPSNGVAASSRCDESDNRMTLSVTV